MSRNSRGEAVHWALYPSFLPDLESHIMELGFTPEQEMLRESAREFLTRECPMDEVRKQLEPGAAFPQDLWNQLAQLGWFGLIVPEKWGGSGLGSLDLAVLQEELGRVLCPAPFASTATVGATALLRAGREDQCERWLPPLARGELRTALAQVENQGTWDATGIQLPALSADGGYRLSGQKLFVADAAAAQLLIVAVRTAPGTPRPENGISLLLVDPDLPGVSVRPIAYNERLRPLAEVTFDDVQIGSEALLGQEGDGWPVLAHVHDHGRVALCAEMCGAAQRVLELSVDYAKTREQFGQPIGRFQAVQHKCSDMLVRTEAIRSAAYYAAWALHAGEPDAHTSTCLAKAFCAPAYGEVAGAGIQIHGGLGFTWEQDLHLYFKHAQAAEFTWGDAAHNRELAAAQLIDRKPAVLSEEAPVPDSQ